ncbi:hypothetical protein N7495_008821 [Penicillium taxi]|uniref:uncharacterized protein n=1 Tax=Penicillium taxi TaxID=168475 RepID=UPI002545AB4C|nr:uncharacterized protein N7495_008821 [Penicillium taxi]KAJ5888780.1 hypothetical protein N7495_008821 [Penicillium taxi]
MESTMDLNSILSHASELAVRSTTTGRPAVYKAVGISLAVASGLFIGVSFVLKKIGLLKANVKYNEEAGEGYGYLKNFYWWSGMSLMIIGEICNFVAYAFVDAILVTPLGALSVVITTILSAIFLKERLSFVGKVGCFMCIIGSVVIAMNAPQQSSVDDIQEMQKYVIAPGFLSYAGVIIVGAAITAFWVGPRYGKKSMFVYISICSMVGGLSVVATQGLGSAILAQINGESQFKHWFFWVLLVFVVCTLLTEIIYLNKALNIFNAALVTPTYYVLFTSATIITSAILFRGFKGTAIEITTVIMGFLQICSGVVLLQLSKSAKDVPDAAVFKGDLDQIREVVGQEEPEYEPKADSIRGTASILRHVSSARRTHENEEARRLYHEKHQDSLEPPNENEIIEWDGLRRRKTVIGDGPRISRASSTRQPMPTLPPLPPLPPLGMSRFPDPENEEHEHDEYEPRPPSHQSSRSFMSDFQARASNVLHHGKWIPLHEDEEAEEVTGSKNSMRMTEMKLQTDGSDDTAYHGARALRGHERSDTLRSVSGVDEKAHEHPPRTPDNLAVDPTAQRQFSFNKMFNRIKPIRSPSPQGMSNPRRGILRRSSHHTPDGATEEERLGLVHGDSRTSQPEEEPQLDRLNSNESELDETQPMQPARLHSNSASSISAFPPYEDHQAFYSSHGASASVSNPYYFPQSRQATASPGPYENWQIPPSSNHNQSHGHTRTRTDSSSHRAPPPAQSSYSTHRHPNPLPPLPQEDDAVLGMRSVSSDSSNLGVASVSSTEAHDDDNRQGQAPTLAHPTYPSRWSAGWRRDFTDESSPSQDPVQGHRKSQSHGRSGAFL